MTKERIQLSFRAELTALINRNSLENGSNTPDYILAEYLMRCLDAFDGATKARCNWYGHEQREDTITSGRIKRYRPLLP
jgi:hypothetical protein